MLATSYTEMYILLYLQNTEFQLNVVPLTFYPRQLAA